MVITDGILYKDNMAVGISYLKPIDKAEQYVQPNTVNNARIKFKKFNLHNTDTQQDTTTHSDMFKTVKTGGDNVEYKTIDQDPRLGSWRIKQPDTWRTKNPFHTYRSNSIRHRNNYTYKNQQMSRNDNYHNEKFKRNFSIHNNFKPSFIKSTTPQVHSSTSDL